MAMVENSQSKVMQEEKENEKDEVYYKVYPDMKRRIDYNERKVFFEISLPGVSKDKIVLKALPTWFSLSGRRGHMEYSANQAFGVKIVPEKTEAKYEDGLLEIIAYIENPMDKATKVEL